MKIHQWPCLLYVGVLLAAQPGLAAVTAVPDLPIPQCFGVQMHVGRIQEGSLPAAIALVKQAGFGWVRTDLDWATVEKQKGVYDFSFYDKRIADLNDADIHMLLELDFTNPHYDHNLSPASPAGRRAFARYAAAAAKHYAAIDPVWEIYNEPNWGDFWKPAPNAAHYTAMADQATAAIHQAAPHAMVVGPALAGPVFDDEVEAQAELFLGFVLRSQAARGWSAITVHPYRAARATPESTGPQLEHLRGLMRKAGVDPVKTPLLASEWGYSTWDKGVDERMQAAYAVRTLLWGVIEHMPFSIWYDWQDDGADTSNKENRFGLLRAGAAGQENLKPAYNAVRQLSQLLDGYRFDRLMPAADLAIVARFVKNGSYAYAVWSPDNTSHAVPLDLPFGTWRAAIISGDQSDLVSEPGTPMPLYAGAMPLVIVPLAPPNASAAP